MTRLLPEKFYRRDALEVAEDLLGHEIWRGAVALRITEVEAYRYPDDTACHNRHGVTDRNRVIWGPPGRAYVYLCYGLHQMLNFVTNRRGEGAAVLVRACEPVRGLSLIRRRRSGLEGPTLLTGPGKVGQALGLDARHNGESVFKRGGLEVRRGEEPTSILSGPRVGIGYASERDRVAPWRLAIAGTPWVSHRSSLSER